MPSSTSPETVALLGKGSHGNKGAKGRWWSMRRVLDLEEAKHQVLLSLPMIICNVSYYSITLVSVMFAGHLGELELAGAALANSWAGVTGFAFMIGLSGALETLCGQDFGAKLYRKLGLHLQASCIISCFFSIIISILWIYTEPIFIWLHQDPRISKTAAIYLRNLIPGLFAHGFLQNILRFLQAQSIVMPLVWFSILPMGTHFGIVYGLVNWTGIGLKGASMAASISLWILFVSLAMYIACSKQLKHTWEGLSSESFRHILTFLKVALPSAAMHWIDAKFKHIYFIDCNVAFEKQQISIDSTRVANELGGGNPEKAKTAMAMALKLSTILTLAVALTFAFGHNVWATFFTGSSLIVHQFASFIPLLIISITFDSFQGILSGFVDRHNMRSVLSRGCSPINHIV
ncbi:hypothetical protein V6N13_014266 [Hibiscus sabdariffa]